METEVEMQDEGTEAPPVEDYPEPPELPEEAQPVDPAEGG